MTILFAAGGTGGHLFPAIATIQSLEICGHKCTLITDRSFEKFSSNRTDVSVEYIEITRHGIANFLRTLIISFIGSLLIMRKYKPKGVVAFGGYPTVPLLAAAVLFRVPIILHEANSVIGTVNKLFLPFARKLGFFFSSLEKSMRNKEKLSLVGIPTTETIQYTEYPKIEGKINILVIGGSQGASIFSEIVPAALELISEEIFVFQQCPQKDLSEVEKKYHEIGINVEISTFFPDISRKLAESHLIISRAGASVIAEILEIGRPAIFIPYPHAKADHQTKNAEIIAQNNAGIVINERELTKELLAETLIDLIQDKNKLKEISHNAHQMAIANATSRFADLIEHVFGGSGKI